MITLLHELEQLLDQLTVIESRAATRLGENVKLLTFISIFYLPLAFCAGLWSINNVTAEPILSSRYVSSPLPTTC
jgi:Mg2+ and Co2+ transporter CorA